jgi:hypothetical protein
VQGTQDAFAHVADRAVGIDLGQIHVHRCVPFARGKPEIDDDVTRDLCVRHERFRGVAKHARITPLPVDVIVLGILGRQTFVSGVAARPDREVDLVGVLTLRAWAFGQFGAVREQQPPG